jgi:hypothetical protein
MISLEKQRELWPKQTPFLQQIPFLQQTHRNWSRDYEVGSQVYLTSHWFEVAGKKVMRIACWLPCYMGAGINILGVYEHPYMDFFQIIA